MPASCDTPAQIRCSFVLFVLFVCLFVFVGAGEKKKKKKKKKGKKKI